jgi:hypothetical protein
MKVFIRAGDTINRLKGDRSTNGWYGGEGGIRTHGRVTPTAVFETARFGRSRTSPFVDARLVGHRKSETSGVKERRAAYLDH